MNSLHKIWNWATGNCYVVSVIVLLCVALHVSLHRLSVVSSEAERYKDNTYTLMESIDTMRTREGLLYARVNDLELKRKEFERLLADDARIIESVRRRNEVLDRLVKASVDTRVEVQTVVRDSVVFVDRDMEKLQVIDWSDHRWESLHAEIRNDTLVRLGISHHDEIDAIVFLDYKRFLWIRTKLRGCSVDLVSRNPYTTNIEVSSVKVIK